MSFDGFRDSYRYLKDVIIHNKIKKQTKMRKIKKSKNVKMNLTISPEFYQVLQQNAKTDFVKVATWTKQFLMKNLKGDKLEKKCLTKNEAAMGN